MNKNKKKNSYCVLYDKKYAIYFSERLDGRGYLTYTDKKGRECYVFVKDKDVDRELKLYKYYTETLIPERERKEKLEKENPEEYYMLYGEKEAIISQIL